jgi:hypothetical protein
MLVIYKILVHPTKIRKKSGKSEKTEKSYKKKSKKSKDFFENLNLQKSEKIKKNFGFFLRFKIRTPYLGVNNPRL